MNKLKVNIPHQYLLVQLQHAQKKIRTEHPKRKKKKIEL